MPRKIHLDFDKLANKSLKVIGDTLIRQAKLNMKKVSYGRVYRVGGRIHIASRAGDTANNMSGTLSRTIRYEKQGYILEFGAGNEKVNYAKYLENGTRKMGARPNYTKSILQNEKKINAEIEKILKKSIKVK